MSALDTALAGRRFAEQQLMVDACRIVRLGGEVYDEAGDSYSPVETEVYAGPCRVKPVNFADRTVEAGGQGVSLWPYQVSLPMSTTDVTLDDVVTVTAAGLDGSLVGLRLRVREVPHGSLLTARRLGCEVQS